MSNLKQCWKCHRSKPLTHFHNSAASSDGKVGRCKPCAKKAAQTWYSENKERACKTTLEWRALNTKRVKLSQMNRSLKRKYGLTLAQFDMLRIAQHNLCAVCKRRRKLCVDHCHKSGQIRMLLCRDCNTGLGLFQDDPVILRRALNLICNPPATKILKQT